MADRATTTLTVAAALAGALSIAAPVSQAGAQSQADMEKCYGIAKAGENDCANAAGTHSCAGQTTQSYSGADRKLVPAGTCLSVGGRLEPFEGQGRPR